MQKECPSCATEIEDGAPVCPICGYEFARTKGSIKWVALILVLLFIWPLIRLLIDLCTR
ncbi:MAG TPA: zinc ribbon domain-containing protein [bacterium]|nr:zinc ribbon domain-containing protein [bacterium]HNT66875.1 zinc ribbon domain-containing protein [bacterium]HOX86457.1 zinc ribbon domain-containing protein [bacterium]HPG47335.1 zinc ribbon domain-containing protein [bacterium]HPM99654.1 zinc ribbon domain-containing protein [bacterium]